MDRSENNLMYSNGYYRRLGLLGAGTEAVRDFVPASTRNSKLVPQHEQEGEKNVGGAVVNTNFFGSHVEVKLQGGRFTCSYGGKRETTIIHACE